MKCETCLHIDICRLNAIPTFGMVNVSCRYEAHELVGEWIENTRYRRKGKNILLKKVTKVSDQNLNRLITVLMCRGLIDKNDKKYINFEIAEDTWCKIPFSTIPEIPKERRGRINIRRRSKLKEEEE